MTSFSRQVPFPQAKWMLPRPSIHSKTCHFENLSKVTLLQRLKPLFHWAENCYWIWSWIIGSHVPMQPAEKKVELCFTVTLKPMTFWSWAAQMVWVLLDGTLLSFVYEPYQARSWRQFGEDAIHFDLIEGREWNMKKYQHFQEKIQAFCCVDAFAVFANVWTTNEFPKYWLHWNLKEGKFFFICICLLFT